MAASISKRGAGPRRILIVDDDPDVLAAIRRAISNPEYAIVCTTSPLDAAEIFGRAPLDLILSDIEMPAMDGHQLMRAARMKCPTAIRILVTGIGTKDAVLRAINEGEVHRFVEKPFDPLELRRVVAEALVRKRELEMVSEAGRRAERREALMTALEQEHGGISEVVRDQDGVYVLDLGRARNLATALGLGEFLRSS